MPARRIGDLYELPSREGLYFFMQHVDTDSSQLGSHVVRVFEGVADAEGLQPRAIAGLPVKFFAHVLLRAGETLKLWTKVGHAPLEKALPALTWRTCPHAEHRLPFATAWELWATNGRRRVVDSSAPELRHAEVGMAMSPLAVVERAHSGTWSFVYPALGSP